MNIATVNRLSFIGFIILLSAWCVVVFQIMGTQEEQSIKNQDYHLRAYHVANQLRQSSDDLTRMARTYVATGNPLYEQYYFEILAIRNGEVPRPRKYPSTYWYTALATDDRTSPENLGVPMPLQTIMHEMGFTEQEFSLLRRSQNRSDTLVRLERQAFAAMKGLFDDGSGHYTVKGEPDSVFATRLLFSPRYNEEKISIMQPIQEFLETVEYRMASEANALRSRHAQYLWHAILLIIISTLMAIIIAAYIRTKVIFPVFSLKRDARIIAEGNYKARCMIRVENEIGSLGQSLNDMADCIELDMNKLKEIATTDELVGINNRRAFLKALEFEVVRSQRYEGPLSLLMMDVDNFKSFNDTYGHPVGDEILKLICNVSQITLRDNDLMGRIGGEEFAFILPETNIDSAVIVAERIRTAIENSSITYNAKKLHTTVSMGATQLAIDDAIDAFQNRADMAMYRSKENGRNQTSWL